jgi:Flp pilus assembly protein CpaB
MTTPVPPGWLLVVRARRALVRPVVRRTAALVLAAVTGLTVSSVLRGAEDARAAWGDSRPVAVATHDLVPGDVVEPGDAQLRDLPEVAIPAVALAEVPAGAVVRQPIAAGEPLVAERLAPDGLAGLAALIPEGQRAVSIPLGPTGAPPLRDGDLVDLLAVLPAMSEIAAAAEPAFPIVERARVVDVGNDAVSVAVPTVDAPSVAYAVTNGIVLVALAGA